jgi:hypothetical protein
MSGLSRTPGKRVRVHSPPRVRIPPSPPKRKGPHSGPFAFWLRAECRTRAAGSVGTGAGRL